MLILLVGVLGVVTMVDGANAVTSKTKARELMKKAGVPIVPVAIRGTFELLPRTTLAPRPGRVDVIIGERYLITLHHGPVEFLEQTRARLAAAISRLFASPVRAVITR